MNQNNIFLLAGRTGGPLSPYPAIIHELRTRINNPAIRIFGVRGGFEQKFAASNDLDLYFLPQAKLDILSFRNSNFLERVLGIFGFFITVVKVVISFLICIFYITKFRPKLIITTGSFLAVPMVLASRITNFLFFTNIKIAVHQLDPMPGLSNRICVRFADLATCVFQYTLDNYPAFYNAKVIRSPILESKFARSSNWQNQDLKNFFDNDFEHALKSSNLSNQPQTNKPTLLIFGGGSGAKIFNEWVFENLEFLTMNFRVVHLTGILQNPNIKTESGSSLKSKNYLKLPAVYEDMGNLMATADCIICRAGVGTITELQFLNSNAFLVPIPGTHQELNAKLVSDQFTILDQNKSTNWLELILHSQPKKPPTNININKADLETYYQELVKLLE
jgi:UDP-N-acetylglucosamine--N-acetylmuramyl-(pentapeptide) pyrophosphoryl-undecaprenol N-acetylglucosamine transferase